MDNKQEVVQYTPGVWESIRQIFGSTARVAVQAANTVERSARTIDTLVSSAEIMAESQNRTVRYSTMGKEMRTMEELKTRYPNVSFDKYLPPELGGTTT